MRSFTLFLLLCVTFPAAGQIRPGPGNFSGSLESNSAFYLRDNKIGDSLQREGFATNNYLKLNYSRGRFSSSLQYEAYLPPLAGYSDRLKGGRLIQGYLRYNGEKSDIIVGNFYEQVGSGLIMRSYEERALGLNNSLLGGIWKYRPTGFLSLKFFAGVPRSYLRYSSTILSGVDGELIISDLLKESDNFFLSAGGSYLHQKNKEIPYLDYPLKIDALSGRINFAAGKFNLSSEYNFRSSAQVFDVENGYSAKRGKSLLINAVYDTDGLGINASLRSLSYMATRTDNNIGNEPVYVNYLPALTKQHKYVLAGLYPYRADMNNEIGFQADIFWELPAALLGDTYPEKISLNFSMYNDNDEEPSSPISFLRFGKRNLFNEMIFELDKRWTPSVKSSLMVMNQQIDRSVAEGYGAGMITSRIIATDILFRTGSKSSLRTEVQHSWSDSREGNWLYGMAEIGLAPHWLFHLGDMYNYNSPGATHYFSTGATYSGGSLRASVAFGRNRAGNQCVGGICHFVPAFSGVTASVTTSF